jgi:hypothetical protein
MASAGMAPDQIAFVLQYPVWMNVVWAVGVWGALLGSALLLLRKKLAFPVFAVSVAAWFVNLLYTYVLTNGGDVMGPSMIVMSVVITVLMLFFIWYSQAMTKRGVLR